MFNGPTREKEQYPKCKVELRRWLTALAVLLVCLAATVSAASGRETLRFGVISLNHPLVMYRQYLPFTDYLAKQLGMEVELVLAGDYQGIVDALVQGRVDIALLAGVSYLKVRKLTDLRLLCAVLSPNGTPTSRSVFVARADRDDMQSLADLKGHSFAFGSRNSTSSYVWPLGYLDRHGITPDEFSHWHNLKTHDAVIRAVLRGTFDAGAVSKEALVRFPQESLKVLATTPPFPGFVLASSPSVPDTLYLRLQSLLLNIDYTAPEVTASLGRWSPMLREGFVAVDENHYLPVQELMEKLAAKGLYGEL